MTAPDAPNRLAISISGPAPRMTGDFIERAVPSLPGAAADLADELAVPDAWVGAVDQARRRVAVAAQQTLEVLVPSPPSGAAPEFIVEQDGPVLTVTFNRPAQRNAMTWAMYDGLYEACERADADDDVRVMVLRGAGEDAFVAGTDITQFAEFADGDDGVAYERKVSRVLDRLAGVDVPTVAAVRGYCVGAGLAIAAVCDLRVAAPDARFGVPIARTLGNCLSLSTYALLVGHLGPGRTLELLLNARMYTAVEMHTAGFVGTLDDDLDRAVRQTADRLAGHAPLTLWATKETLRRLRRTPAGDGDDIVRRVYGSEDFHNAVRAFSAKQEQRWTGR